MEPEYFPAPEITPPKVKTFSFIVDEYRWQGNAVVLSRVDLYGSSDKNNYKVQTLTTRTYSTLEAAQKAYCDALPKSRQEEYKRDHMHENVVPAKPSRKRR